uniref:BRISC and BRCA1-A complex member 2 n=1 Tax=Zea mays TaxID=4577 RepID=A0A804QIY7_MAIZE
MLDVYGRMGRSWPWIVTLLNEMHAVGVETDGFTASTVIAACCRDGLVDEAVASTIELYIEYQKERVHMVDDARLAFELSTDLSKEGIEVCMVPSADRPDDAKFVVPLLESDFDFAIAKLVPGCPWRLPQKIHLQETII